jgi:adenine C2-methylase RlmN of 23S rRNA A2503 and tRNA A37
VLRSPIAYLAWCFTLLAASVLEGSCTSRTLPLPPPQVSSVSSPLHGKVTVSGYALEGASVGVVNDRTLQGTVVTSPKTGCESTCPFEATLEARTGDNLRVWQFFETESSIDAVVPAP